jgi:hypothetical protein
MRKLVLLAIVITLLIVTISLFSEAFADITVGAKKGDWITYKVTETGNPTPDYEITWARIDVTAVQGEKITINVQTGFANGTIYPEPQIPLNLATGAIGDGFFVPVNLNVGDKFYSEYQGNITITSIWQREVGGALRTVISATSNQTTYNWDRQTGILVGATTSFPAFTLSTQTSGTSLWQPQILGLDSTLFYEIIVIIIVSLVAVFAILIWQKRKIN